MKILLVGEAWGEIEAEHEHAFVGPAGLQLISQLARSGLGPKLDIRHPSAQDQISYWSRARTSHGIDIANVFNHHPPDNRIGHFFSSDGNRDLPSYKPSQKEPVGYVLPEFMPHVIRLWDLVRASRPNLVLALGNIPCWALLHQTKISAIRGAIQRAIPSLRPQKILPTFHPSYILRVKSDEVIALADFQKAKREAEFPEIRRIERWITGPRPDQRITLEEIEEWLNRPAEAYSVDIESGYVLYSKAELARMTQRMKFILSSQISMVGFARSSHDALVIPLMDRNTKTLMYFSQKDEVKAWKLHHSRSQASHS